MSLLPQATSRNGHFFRVVRALFMLELLLDKPEERETTTTQSPGAKRRAMAAACHRAFRRQIGNYVL